MKTSVNISACLLLLLFTVQHLFAQTDNQHIAKANKKTPRTYDAPMTLLAGTGFNDGNNDVNMYASELYFIHGNDRFNDVNTGFFGIPFASSETDFPQLAISLSHIKLGKGFTLSLRIWANLNTNYDSTCRFHVKKINDGGLIKDTIIYFKEAHFPDVQTHEKKDLLIHIAKGDATQTGIYYIYVTGCYSDTALWYEISEITLKYD
jgi:hypothetical protein